METALKAAALSAGAHGLQALLQDVGVGRRDEAVRCRCGQTTMASAGVREKRVVTLLGLVRFARSLYRCPRCGKTRYPGDEELGIERTSRSPGIQRQVSRLGAKEPFREVAQDMNELAGIDLSRKDAERIPRRVKLLLSKGCLVTIDAVGCQRGIAQTTIDAGADYLLAVKDNQETPR